MKPKKIGIWATMLTAGLLAISCNTEIRKQDLIFQKHLDKGHICIYKNDIKLESDEYNIVLEGSAGEKLEIADNRLLNIRFFDEKDGVSYKLGDEKGKKADEESLLFCKNSNIGTIKVWEQIHYDEPFPPRYKLFLTNKEEKYTLEVSGLFRGSIIFQDRNNEYYRLKTPLR